jgi:hypothetical protein
MARNTNPSRGTATRGPLGGIADNGNLEPSLQRIPSTLDPLGSLEGPERTQVLQLRLANTAVLFKGVQQLVQGLGIVKGVLADRPAPAQLIATLVQPDGHGAARVQVQFDPAALGKPGPMTTVITDGTGNFQLALPAGSALQEGGSLALTIHGGSANVVVKLPFAQIAANGLAGQIALPQFMSPLPVSIIAALEAIALPPPVTAPPPPPDNVAQLPVVKIGDDDDCLLKYGLNQSIDRFPYGIFFRLVEPRASIASVAFRWGFEGGAFNLLPQYDTQGAGADPSLTTTYVDRVPVDQPLSIDGFRDRLAGAVSISGGNQVIVAAETVPMAGTLGLGYVLHMSQRWTFKGLALGDLVYSLPLAPGEQQQVAIFERRDVSAVFESETFSEEQALLQSATADTSTTATFNSAFNEVINGRSSFQADSSTSSVGGSFFGLVSGGSGSSSSSGSSTSSLQGQRDVTQNAAQATHSSAQNASYARRNASRTGMRIASASESQTVTTKTITNHNHTRALTMQYWEVLRLYDLSTAIDGLTLTVLVPLQVVRFLAVGQLLNLDTSSFSTGRPAVLARYAGVLKHADVLARSLPRKYQYGLSLLTQFAADPTADVEPSTGAAEDVIQFDLTGSFIGCEDVYVTAVTSRGTRLGPVKLELAGPPTIAPDTYAGREELLNALRGQRQAAVIAATGALALPQTMNRNAIVGFEIRRNFRTLAYTLLSPAQAAARALGGLTASTLGDILGKSATDRPTVVLDAGMLENNLGGPILSGFTAKLFDPSSPSPESYVNLSVSGIELTQDPYPIPAVQLAPILRYRDLLEVENMTQHVVRNTLRYSQAVWASLSALERAVLLEGYTIGVPAGGLVDASQMIPLLNCVENRIIGFFGNSMIMPFIIPESLANAMGAEQQPLDPADLVNHLLAYQQASFVPPRSTVALPTHGVLGEAVLGHCSSAEKIDLTRFWNRQDSPSDVAPAISPVTLSTGSPSLLQGVTAPNSLTTLPSLINNVLTAPSPDTSLLQAMSKDAASQKDFATELTGASQLATLLGNAQNVSNSARADALKTSKELQSQVIATVGNIVGGLYGGNPKAGSNAAAALNGKDTGSDGSGGGASGAGGSGGSGSGGSGSGGSGGGGSGGSGGSGGGGSGGGGSGGGSGGGGSGGGSGAGGSGGGAPVPTPGPGGGPVPV